MNDYIVSVDDSEIPFDEIVSAVEDAGATLQASQEAVGTIVVSLDPNRLIEVKRVAGVVDVEPAREDYAAQ